MAGIGVKLNRIYGKNSIAAGIVGVGYSAVATVAPMVLIILSIIGMQFVLDNRLLGYVPKLLFASTVLYIFVFALLTASPFNSVISRYLSDVIYNEAYDDILPCYYTGLIMNVIFSCLFGIPFSMWAYFSGGLELAYVFAAYCGYMLLVLILYSMLYLSILKEYGKITTFYFFGAALTVLLSWTLVKVFYWEKVMAMLVSLDVGFLLIACLEMGMVRHYFKGNSGNYRGILEYMKKYWKLVLANFLYILGLYIHNFVFWTTDLRIVVENTFVCVLPYDMASCLAMFTNISSIVIFISRVEMAFHERYKAYSEAVIGGRWKDIENAKNRMFRQLSTELMNLLRLQFIVTAVIYLLAVVFLPQYGYGGLTMRIYPCMAAGYFILFIMYAAIIYLYYFNDLTGALLTTSSFCLTTFVVSIIATHLPDVWYGLGITIGSLIGWIVAYFRLRWLEKNIDIHIFCNGNILKRGKGIQPDSVVFDRTKENQKDFNAKKKILFVINTLGKAGAETALMELLRKIPKEQYEVSIFVLLGQGEVIEDLPDNVKLLNKKYNSNSVLDKTGRKDLYKNIFVQIFRNGAIFRRSLYLIKHAFRMISKKQLKMDKLLWYCLADGAQKLEDHYDLAVAYLEGGSAYYVADYVSADKKAAFVHIDYSLAGYNRDLDKNCYLKYDQIFTVSKEVKEAFVKVYPEVEEKTEVFENILNIEKMKEKALESGGFEDDFDGFRILTVGRLSSQKALEVSIEAMSLLKSEGKNVRWYVLGDGDQRQFLEKQIQKFDVEKEFILMGAVPNPFPYYVQADLYVHASRYEGKSIAIQEAMAMGCAVLITDCSGNREQVTHGMDGELCEFNAESISHQIAVLMDDPEKRESYGKNAAQKISSDKRDIEKLYRLL